VDDGKLAVKAHEDIFHGDRRRDNEENGRANSVDM